LPAEEAEERVYYVPVLSVESVDGVGEVVLSDLSDHVTGRVLATGGVLVPVAHDGLDDHQGEVVGISPAGSGESEGDVCGIVTVETNAQVGADDFGGLELDGLGGLGRGVGENLHGPKEVRK
jgi:hypothetical protein